MKPAAYDKQYVYDNSEHFMYLFALRDSGRTNMFGAAAYLEVEQDLDKATAKQILMYWMEHFQEIAKEFHIET